MSAPAPIEPNTREAMPDVEAAPAPVIRMIGNPGALCIDDSCSIESFIGDDPA